jgi:energy-coupling factor transport system ATP-binding protein
MTENIAIETRQLEHVYSGRVRALRGVDLRIRQGEFLAVIGQNGSGKTTLTKHFNGLLKPTSGDVIVNGLSTKNASIAQLAKRVGYVFQNPDHQLCMRTVQEELSFGPRNLGIEPAEIKSRVDNIIKAFDLEKYRQTHPFLLGRADRLRVAVCSVLTMEPDIVVVDEPTTGQDMRQSYELMEMLKNLNEQGRTIVFITHNMRLVAEYARRTVVMRQGSIVMDDWTAEVFSHPDILADTFLSPPQITQLAQRLGVYGIPPGILSVKEMDGAMSKLMESAGRLAAAESN